jgi:molybdenum-dependent DNA-binding transcriptional regulator ModE
MTDRYYDTSAGEFIDFETLDDWAARDAAKDARIEALEAKLERAEEQEVKAHRQGYEQARAACTEFTRALVERIKSLEAEQNRLGQQCEGLAQAASNNGQALIIAEAKLAKAVEALEYYAVEAMARYFDDSLIARTALAEIKGGTNDQSATES